MNRTSVVTGAASGIGAATKRYLEERGERVIGCNLHDADVIADLTTPVYWFKSFDFHTEQEIEDRVELDERATWFYEAVSSSKGMPTRPTSCMSPGRYCHGVLLAGSIRRSIDETLVSVRR